jgi:tRNA (cytidine56-2'-O)-methyltransferase
MITVLRIGHRPKRDKRITTHVALVARAFGANGIIINEEDPKIEENVKAVVSSWGGDFSVKHGNWRPFLRSFEGKIVHLTMYGLPFEEKMEEIVSSNEDICVVVGAEKVPSDIYKMADYNLAVGNQPHSEVAALAMFLDRYHQGRQFGKTYPDAKIVIEPSERNKVVIGDNRD